MASKPLAAGSSVVPTIDLRGEREQVAKDIDVACRNVGFFQIIGHGVDSVLEEKAWSTAREFFQLPVSQKKSVAIAAGHAYGYGAFKAESLAASLGQETPPDLKETFSVGPTHVLDAGACDDPAAAFVFSETPWPHALPKMEPIMVQYYNALSVLAENIMSLMATGLGLSADTFSASIDKHPSALRLLHYPDLNGHNVEKHQLRAGAHSDYGTLTLLRQDDAAGGLQVRDVDGIWHNVPPVDGAYVVNVGDALERWTNDTWKSTVHRVITPPTDIDRDCTRHSIAFFHNANWDALITCLDGCAVPGSAPKYAPITAGRHLMDKFQSTQK